MTFRVATLNLEQDHKRWDARRELIIEQLAAIQPDVFALNEVCIPQQTARWIQKSARERIGIEYNLVPADASEWPRRDRRRGAANPLSDPRDRQPGLPDAGHGGAGRAHRRRRDPRRCLCDSPLHVPWG